MLKIEGISKSFGGLEVLKRVDMNVEKGEIVGLLGPNGSGKTTLLNIVSGFLRASAGVITYDGREITALESHRISQLGIRRTFQLPRMPSKMSCAEVMLTSVQQNVSSTVLGLISRPVQARAEQNAAKKRVFGMIDRLSLGPVADRAAAALSGGQQKLLALGAAVLGGAKMLLLDEPTAGVNPALRLTLVETLHEIRDQGVTIVVVEHDMGFIARLCDRCVVLDRSAIIANCKPSELLDHHEVVEAYLGRRANRTELEPGRVA